MHVRPHDHQRHQKKQPPAFRTPPVLEDRQHSRKQEKRQQLRTQSDPFLCREDDEKPDERPEAAPETERDQAHDQHNRDKKDDGAGEAQQQGTAAGVQQIEGQIESPLQVDPGMVSHRVGERVRTGDGAMGSDPSPGRQMPPRVEVVELMEAKQEGGHRDGCRGRLADPPSGTVHGRRLVFRTVVARPPAS